MLSPKNTTTVGGRVYTTFFMNLTKQDECYQELDKAGCCNANISTIWLDVGEQSDMPNLSHLFPPGVELQLLFCLQTLL